MRLQPHAGTSVAWGTTPVDAGGAGTPPRICQTPDPQAPRRCGEAGPLCERADSGQPVTQRTALRRRHEGRAIVRLVMLRVDPGAVVFFPFELDRLNLRTPGIPEIDVEPVDLLDQDRDRVAGRTDPLPAV